MHDPPRTFAHLNERVDDIVAIGRMCWRIGAKLDEPRIMDRAAHDTCSVLGESSAASFIVLLPLAVGCGADMELTDMLRQHSRRYGGDG